MDVRSFCGKRENIKEVGKKKKDEEEKNKQVKTDLTKLNKTASKNWKQQSNDRDEKDDI